MADFIKIAIDGPGGAGKSTIAKAVAERLGFVYIDTGAMYRAVAYKVMRENCPWEDPGNMEELLKRTKICFSEGKIYLDDENVEDHIRSEEVSAMASKVAKIPIVRNKLVDIQRAIGERVNVVMDGRDIGTNVFKDAPYKFFLTASSETRAERRFKQLQAKGKEAVYETILDEIKKRDYEDSHRKHNPLVAAEDAVLIDSTDMSPEQVIDFILKAVRT